MSVAPRLIYDSGKMDLSVNTRPTSTSSRILYDIPCKVCQDHSSGKHYGIFACDGCAGFFKRSIRRNRQYVCKAKDAGGCLVDKTHRNQCRACRLTRCVEAGMNKDAVQHERGPRNSTIRRQMSLLYGEGVANAGVGGDSLSPSAIARAQAAAAAAVAAVTSARIPISSAASSPSSVRDPLPESTTPESVGATTSFDRSAPVTSPMQSTTTSSAMDTSLLHTLVPSRPLALPYLAMPKYSLSDLCLPPSIASPDALCESAARIVFGNIEWAKYLPAFNSLPLKDQVILLQEGWRELFLLSLSQTLLPVEADTLLSLSAANRANNASISNGLPGSTVNESSTDAVLPLLKQIGQLRDCVARLRTLHVDATEYMCLKWIVLFRNEIGGCSGRSIQQAATISLLQDQAQLTLLRYVTSAHPGQPLRLTRLLMAASALRDTSAALIERLFFQNTLKDITIERVIADMLKKSDVL